MTVPEDPFNETERCHVEDAKDGILQAGLRLASTIAGEAATYGRRRDMPDEHTSETRLKADVRLDATMGHAN